MFNEQVTNQLVNAKGLFFVEYEKSVNLKKSYQGEPIIAKQTFWLTPYDYGRLRKRFGLAESTRSRTVWMQKLGRCIGQHIENKTLYITGRIVQTGKTLYTQGGVPIEKDAFEVHLRKRSKGLPIVSLRLDQCRKISINGYKFTK